ncbi:cation:proton antiporter domain-containing protein [Actinomadura nitritigenes]|uniref:cation:proton antiporter domain-containing protein n=1 Tax=Actinomadura nitritigenes TaxID=134602 RepID=UPI003D91B7AE
MPITALAIGLTTVTTFTVAAVLRWVLRDLGWAAAIALGAAVAPTDPVAAISIMKRLDAPVRIVTIIEGENLVNGAVALTAFVLAVEALTTHFTIGHGIERLAVVVAGGVAYGAGSGVHRVPPPPPDPSTTAKSFRCTVLDLSSAPGLLTGQVRPHVYVDLRVG